MANNIIPNVNPGDLVGSTPTFPTNAVVKGDFLYLRDANGNQISGRTVSDGDEITVLDIGYSKQLVLVQYPTGSGYRQGYVSNATSIIKYKDDYSWVNGSTPEAVYDLDKTTQIGTLDPRERAVVLYKVDGMTAVAYDTGKGKLTKSGLVHYEGSGSSNGGGSINGIAPGEVVPGGFTYENNAQVVGDELYLRDANGNRIPGRSVSDGDKITVLDVGYTKQLALVQYPAGSVVRQGYVTNVPSIIKYFKQNQWHNGSTTEPVLDENGGSLGSLSPYEAATPLYKKNGMTHVVYGTNKGPNTKSGYVKYEGTAVPPNVTIPSVSEPNVDKLVYGLSGNGRALEVYKMGKGNKILFAGFGLHGFEDSWDRDGVALAKIATELIKELAAIDRTQGLNGWTVYIAPCMNPDGLLEGWTNNGPGRCTISTSIDLNRSFPVGFTVRKESRNYTGSRPLLAPEAKALSSYIENLKKNSSRMVFLDCHGWLNKTIGNYSIGKIFCDEFKFSHDSSYGGGYLTAWTNSLGIESVLLEYPMIYSTQDAINRGFVTKTLNGFKKILSLSSSNGEVELNARGKVVNVTSVLNVRAAADINSGVIGTLRANEIVDIVAEKSDWYKIRFNNGYGYVNKLYINLINNDSKYEIIIASGQEGDKNRFKYNFIEPAIKKIIEAKSYYNKETDLITWIIDKGSYSPTDIQNFIRTATSYGVIIKFVSSRQEFVNYINTQDITGNGMRSRKIKEFVLFGHGEPQVLLFGHDYNIDKELLKYVNTNAFSFTKSHFYSCNTGTGKAGSFAQAWANVTNGYVQACVLKTNYDTITYSDIESNLSLEEKAEVKLMRLETGYKQDGSYRYPKPGKDAYWEYFTGNNIS